MSEAEVDDHPGLRARELDPVEPASAVDRVRPGTAAEQVVLGVATQDVGPVGAFELLDGDEPVGVAPGVGRPARASRSATTPLGPSSPA